MLPLPLVAQLCQAPGICRTAAVEYQRDTAARRTTFCLYAESFCTGFSMV
jgi:hypothetical protein